ncbi:hypothetical protein BOX15_Mlig020126g3, partial [Macrostomum lignano]
RRQLKPILPNSAIAAVLMEPLIITLAGALTILSMLSAALLVTLLATRHRKSVRCSENLPPPHYPNPAGNNSGSGNSSNDAEKDVSGKEAQSAANANMKKDCEMIDMSRIVQRRNDRLLKQQQQQQLQRIKFQKKQRLQKHKSATSASAVLKQKCCDAASVTAAEIDMVAKATADTAEDQCQIVDESDKQFGDN